MSELTDFWEAEEKAPFSGWSFAHLDGRLHEEALPWSYESWLKEFLKSDTKLLDMGTGGGEFLLSLKHPYNQTSVTEAWEPNYQLCLKRLAPLGICVEHSHDDKPLPFTDESFDLLINRHGRYNLSEVNRVLKKGGHFITQQVGAGNGVLLSNRLGLGYQPSNPAFNLENEAIAFQKAGFRVVKRGQCYPTDYFTDIGALCYYAKTIPWEFPNFSVKRCLSSLTALQKDLEENGKIFLQEHRFILVAKKQMPVRT